MFKKIVAEIIQATTLDELNKIDGTIDRAFEAGKITFKDHEMLFDLMVKVSGGALWRPGIVCIKKEG